MALNTIEMLNSIRNSASTDYQDRIPVATRDNLLEIGRGLLQYKEIKNEFTGAIGKIALQLFNNYMGENKLKPLKSGELIYGSDIEEFFVERAKGNEYDPEGPNPLTRKKPEIKIMYHRKNYSAQYDVSLSDTQIRTAFTSVGNLNNLMSMIVNSLYAGAEDDEYINMKEILATYFVKDEAGQDTSVYAYADYEVPKIVDKSTAERFVKTVRKAVSDMSYASKNYNAMGVTTKTNKENIYFLVHKDVIAEVDVEVLAKAYNMGKTDFEPTIIEVDNFGSMENTYGLLIDKDFMKVYDVLFDMETMRNGKGKFTNYFLTVEQIHSISRFKNAIRLVTPPVTP